MSNVCGPGGPLERIVSGLDFAACDALNYQGEIMEAIDLIRQMQWQPIETAPKDGTLVLLFRPSAHEWGRVAPGKWHANEHAASPRPFWDGWLKIGARSEWREWQPTHWMPLPAPPLTANTGANGHAARMSR